MYSNSHSYRCLQGSTAPFMVIAGDAEQLLTCTSSSSRDFQAVCSQQPHAVSHARMWPAPASRLADRPVMALQAGSGWHELLTLDCITLCVASSHEGEGGQRGTVPLRGLIDVEQSSQRDDAPEQCFLLREIL